MSAWKVALYSAVILTVLWLLAPSRSAQAPEPGVVEINLFRRGAGAEERGALDDAVRQFEEDSDRAHAQDPSKPRYRVVSGQNASRNQTEDPTRFLVSVAGGMPPDVIVFDRFAVTEWASRGAFHSLDEFLARERASNNPDAIRAEDFYDSCWDEVVYRDPVTGKTGVYGIPEKVDNRALFYNKDLLKRAGYDAPPKTWEELEEMGVKLTEKNRDGRITRLGFAPNEGNSWLYLYGWMNGGQFMSPDGKRCTLNDPKVMDALTWMTRVYDKLGGAENVNAFKSTFQGGDLDPFITGKLAMKIDGFWQITDTIAQFGRNVNYGLARPPIPAAQLASGSKTCTWVSGWCYAIPSTAKNKEAGWELIRFLSSQRGQEVMAESKRLTLASQGRVFVPTQCANKRINQWLFDKYVINNPSMDSKVGAAVLVFNELLEGQPYRPVTPVGQLLWNQHISAMDNAIYHKLSPQQSLDNGTKIVQRDLDRVLSPPRGTAVNWNVFFVLYGVLLVGTAVGVYVWDTNEKFRQKFGKWSKHGGDLEGTHSSFFRSQWKGGWVCALPWIIGFVVFTGGPILFSIIISFCDFDILNPARFTGFTNYGWMFTNDPQFWKALWNTVYMVIGIPLGLSLSLGIALLLTLKVRGVALWRTFFYLPSIVPAVASSILWIWIFNPSGGLLNTVLASMGITGPNWLQNEHTSKPALILMGLWGAGGGMIIWIAGLKGISESYYEAASLDGAGTWQKFRHVTLPLLTPYIFFNLIMGLIGTFQIFTQAFIMTQGGPVDSTLFYAYHLFNNAFRYLHMGYAASMAWILFLIVFGLTVVQLNLQKRWVHYEEGWSDTQYKLMEFCRHSWIYALLVGGSIIFAWPFLWMAATSVKVDREMFGEKIRLWPQRPIPQVKSPYIDTRYFRDVAGKRMAEILPAIEQRLGDLPPEAARSVASGVYKKLLLTVPDAEWDKPVNEIVARVDAAMIDGVLNQVRRHLAIGQLRARSKDLQEDQLVAPETVATAWQVTGPAQLVPANEGRDLFADLHYDFSTGDTIELSQTFTTSFPVDRLYRLQLYLRSDDTWHALTVYVEKLGKKFKAERSYDLADFNWGIGTWQERGPDDISNKIRTWIVLREVGDSPVAGDHQLKVTVELKKNSALGAWLAKATRNYRTAFDNMPFWRYVATSVFLVILNLVGTLLSCSLVAYSFARLQWPGRNFCFALMLATMMIPGQVTMIPYFLIIRTLGWYNTLYPLWVNALFASAFNVFLLRQFLKGIPRDLEDAAKIDGCGFWRIYWHIMLPLIKPTLAAIAIFTFMGAWNDFMGPLIYLSDQRLYPLSFGLYALNVQSGAMGLMMAGSLLMTLPVIIIFFFAQKYFIQGVTLTGMKG